MTFLEKRVFSAVAMCALLLNASVQASDIEDDILLFAPASSSTYNLSQVAVYLGDLLALTEGFEAADAVFEASAARSLLESYVNPDYKANTIASVTAGYRHVILLDNFTFNRDFPEMGFEGTYQLSKTILRAGATPILLMDAGADSDMAQIQENAYRIANGCGIHLIPAGVGAQASKVSFPIPAFDDDRASYLVASMIYSQITDQSASSTGYVPESGGSPISEAVALSDLAESTQASEFAQTQYSTDIGNEGVIRYRPIDISSAPFNGTVRYIYSGTSTERGTSDRLSDIITETYSVGKTSLGNSKDLSTSDLTGNAATLSSIEDQAAFIYVRRSYVTADTVRSYSQDNLFPIMYDRPWAYSKSNKNTVESTRVLLRDFHNDLAYYLWKYQDFGWNLLGFHAALGRLYELEPTLIATADGTHMTDPLYQMLASQMLTSALGTELPPPPTLSGQSLLGYQIGQEFIKQVAHLSEDGAFTPDSRLSVIEPTPHLAEPGVSYSLQLQAEAGSEGYSWEVDPGAPLPDGLSLSEEGLISGIPTAFFGSQTVVVKVTDADGAFRKAHLTLQDGFPLVEIELDDPGAELTGTWSTSVNQTPYVGDGYRYAGTAGTPNDGSAMATWRFTAATGGVYQLNMAYTPGPTRATNVTLSVTSGAHVTTFTVDQTVERPEGSVVRPIGTVQLVTDEETVITIGTSNTTGFVILDAVQLVLIPAALNSPEATFQMDGTGQASFTIETVAGIEYRLVYKNELTSTDGWLPVIPPAPDGWTNGTGGSIMISDPGAAVRTQRFYRIEARTPGAE